MKTQQRNDVKRRRDAIPDMQRMMYSEKIVQRIASTQAYQQARVVMAYHPFRSEVDISLLLDDIIRNKHLVLPRTNPKNVSMTPYRVVTMDDLCSGAYGIMEPKASCATIDIPQIDLVIVPLVAFDDQCNRMGYGGGYYDRFLEQRPTLPTMGAAFEQQRVDLVHVESTDIKLHWVATEAKLYRGMNNERI